MSGIKVDGQWKVPGTLHVKESNSWKIVATTHAKVNGVWRITTFGAPPDTPVFDQTSHVAAGKFQIKNYDSTLVYDDTRVSGSGTASRTGDTYTLSNVNAAFDITAAYAVGAPTSDPEGYIERKAYTFTPVPPSCYPNPPSCSPNCAPAYDCAGPAGFPGCIPCWGYGPDGSPAAGGAICCGGSRGATCSPNPPSCYPNPPSKDPTPTGYYDSFGEWWRVG